MLSAALFTLHGSFHQGPVSGAQWSPDVSGRLLAESKTASKQSLTLASCRNCFNVPGKLLCGAGCVGLLCGAGWSGPSVFAHPAACGRTLCNLGDSLRLQGNPSPPPPDCSLLPAQAAAPWERSKSQVMQTAAPSSPTTFL